MKDFYDLYLISRSSILDEKKLMKNIEDTFKNRGLEPTQQINFNENDIQKIQISWARFVKSQDFSEIPGEISDVIKFINRKLKESAAKS